MRLIDADALIKDLGKWMKEVDPKHPNDSSPIPPIEDIIVSTMLTIEEQPTIEERKNGAWIPEFNGEFKGGAYWFKCSECGRIVPEVRNGGWDYCPNCGCRMEE